jgi:uncharacterized RDD family membrane protein YckC
MVCQFCGQVEGLPSGVHLASPGKRFAGYLVDVFFMVVLAFIGWLIWSLIVWERGQTPGKQVLGMRTVKLRTGRRATWGTMFVREVIGKFVVGSVLWATLIGVIFYFWLLWDKNRQELWDKFVDTIVVNDPDDAVPAG